MAQPTTGLSEGRNLRSGSVPWREADWTLPPAGGLSRDAVDIAIIGTGIMGAILAERLSAGGRRVALLDRRPPGCGSTAASTAQLMWTMDVPMLTLAGHIGETEAARRWTRVLGAVRDLSERIEAMGLSALKQDCPTLYLTGGLLDDEALAAEAAMHRRHGLPSQWLDGNQVRERFGIAPRAAILSDGGFTVDPVRLCHALIELAVSRGAALAWPVNVIGLHPDGDRVHIEMEGGDSLHAGEVILATGYERPSLFLPSAFSLLTSFAMATPPGMAPLWKGNAMIWEASDPYLYLRTDESGRIIAGGEDIEEADADTRDALISQKAGVIAAKLETLLGAPVTIDRQWAATFGASPDGLPAIGATSLMPHVWLAAGYGGNGIAFASLAAQMLERELAGEADPDRDAFDPYRFDSNAGQRAADR
ncbi:NAD(P)/FAD-dependent oxidoreductase [Sphingobium scionense]|uniref:Glycine/D-amino acid oxidase-like deaminating enzyme n=1 Tax=Sphingobium scionense TaxID=1404341 RepID=A0A7W6PWL5_9SPHN|nr:FAD-dependent oxidoreductase [Sphingobium scionense]MBB4149953.1 glycine/D-amino acid oxidase-like deaminating enzyme [Sphingobium scionense]